MVGAGGAGFPTYVKLSQPVDILIVNGAECEPLLRKDNVVMRHFTAEFLAGLELIRQALTPRRTVIGIKEKNRETVEAVRAGLNGDIELQLLEDYYPAGDEANLVYEVSGKTIPPGGIPLQIDIVVMNVETIVNIHQAERGQPVTHTMVTVGGAVRQPVTALFPVGLSFEEAIRFAGSSPLRDYVAIDGGPMMGRVVEDMSTPLVKTSSGIIVIPCEHGYARQLLKSATLRTRIGRSVCDQCNMCTQMCPRYLLGYQVEPHQVMRHQQTRSEPPASRWGELCVECGLCTLAACPEGLDPRLACQLSKQSLQRQETAPRRQPAATPHPMYAYRKLSGKQMLRKLGLKPYDTAAPFRRFEEETGRLTIPLRQHIGQPAAPVVKTGSKVKAGELIADVPAPQLGVGVHAPRTSEVISVNQEEIVIQ